MITEAQWETRRQQLAEELARKAQTATQEVIDYADWQPARKVKPVLPTGTKIHVYLSGYLVEKTIDEVTQDTWRLAATKWRVAS
ncbi:hypothetical protein [Vibrio phage V-YDF132]|nr:hypothetical protein [Vibrio phage V-YDF132]